MKVRRSEFTFRWRGERGETPAKLLVVDDDEQIRRVLTSLLCLEGYLVIARFEWQRGRGTLLEDLCRI